jgi:4-amino-4-deoxy-L-arabinose transferase-like glycosyltransferase
MRALLGVALALFVACTAAYLTNTLGHALQEGDEAIYAEFAREMAATGDLVDLRWQNEVQIVRPPMSVWILAVARGLFPDERSVRLTNAAAAGAQVALVFLLGFTLTTADDRRRRWVAGLGAAMALATADLFIGYARYFESEPLLIAFILAAWLAWEVARNRPWTIYLWGAFLGAALMTKQLVGGLPLLLPIVESIVGGPPRLSARRWLRGLAVTAVVWLPWHLWALARHGGAFVRGYLGRNVIERAQAPMLHTTRPTFYVRELWRSEGLFTVLFIAALVCTLVQLLRHRRRTEAMLAAATLLPLVVFSLAATRHDYYLLLVYPGLALMVGRALAQLPIKAGGAAVAAWALAAGLWHLPRNLASFAGEDELRSLMVRANVEPAPRLYAFNRHVYAMRYYLDPTKEVRQLLESEEDLRAAEWLKLGGMPAPSVLARDLPATLATRPRPWLLVMPRARYDLLRTVPLRRVGETRHYVLDAGG